MPASDATKILLDEQDIPTHWYNIVADLPPPPAPVLHPGTGQPIGPADLAPLFPMALIGQEVSQEPRIEIPDEVRDVYRLWRPTPLLRARRLEKALQTPAHIYYKYEGVSPAGSHKPNTAVAQAYYNKADGIKRLTTETGAGQWGSALAFACALFGLECTVYMVKASFQQKPYRRSMIQTYGAEVFPSPSNRTNAGRKVLQQDPESPGSLGIAISEAVEDAATHDDAHYSLGSVLNHVLLHQTVIGQEALKQMEIAGEYPDVVIGCVGGGSNFAGLAFPFVGRQAAPGQADRASSPSSPRPARPSRAGIYAYDFGDTVGLTPLVKMHTLGHGFMPPAIHAGGLRYHGAAPLLSQLVDEGTIEARAYGANRRVRGGDAVRAQRGDHSRARVGACHSRGDRRGRARHARRASERVILFNLSGHGHFDMGAYDAYLAGALQDYAYPAEAIQHALTELPKVAAPA